MKSDEAIVEIAGSGIPDHVRQSISRLVENQVMEAEEQERVLAESRGEPVRPRDSGRSRVYDDVDDEEEDVHRVRIVGEGDASGDEDVEGDSDKVVDVRSPFIFWADWAENTQTIKRSSIRSRPTDQIGIDLPHQSRHIRSRRSNASIRRSDEVER